MKKKIKGLPLCECGHSNAEHCRSVEEIHHCKEYGCKCEKWNFSGKYEKFAKKGVGE